jgi:glutamate/tyrosine decarboxylase-like PLP-dependent enzyme
MGCLFYVGKERVFRQSTVFIQSKLSDHFMCQLASMHRANSITLDPHKSGFCPYPAGGLLYR